MDKTQRAKFGQFNTEESQCKFIIDLLRQHFDLGGDILEPSFGSGNFVSELKKFSNQIDCYEIDKNVFKSIDGTNSILGDFLFSKVNKKYDFIIGNPPYIELTYSFYSSEDKKKLKNIFSFDKRGRVNLIHFFLDKSFDLLKDNGVIAYLLPSTILSSPWYNDIRKKIYEEYTIVDIVNKIPFQDVSIDVSLLILQKKVDPNHKFIRLKNEFYTLTKNPSIGKTLSERGFECHVGNILWYKNKDLLTNQPTNRILVYSNNIENGKLNVTKKLKSKIGGKNQYLNTNSKISDENCIVMPRVISKKMRFCLIKNNTSYLFENHVMIITHKNMEMLEELYEKLMSNQLNFSDYFNSSNITIKEILNFEY